MYGNIYIIYIYIYMAVRHYIPRLNGPPQSIESSYLVVIPCRHTFVMLFVSASRQYLVVIPFY